MVGALNHVRDERLDNVRLHMGDALDVVERLPDASLERVYLLHPDPWPKARHAKRRMVNDGPLDLIAAKLKPGGEFRLGTDDPTYCRWAMMVMNRRRDFDWTAQTAQRFPDPPRRLARNALRAQGAARRATRSGISDISEPNGSVGVACWHNKRAATIIRRRPHVRGIRSAITDAGRESCRRLRQQRFR